MPLPPDQIQPLPLSAQHQSVVPFWCRLIWDVRCMNCLNIISSFQWEWERLQLCSLFWNHLICRFFVFHFKRILNLKNKWIILKPDQLPETSADESVFWNSSSDEVNGAKAHPGRPDVLRDAAVQFSEKRELTIVAALSPVCHTSRPCWSDGGCEVLQSPHVLIALGCLQLSNFLKLRPQRDTCNHFCLLTRLKGNKSSVWVRYQTEREVKVSSCRCVSGYKDTLKEKVTVLSFFLCV